MTKSGKSWRDIMPVHPAADLFPMMSEDELRELGEDIKKNGLKSPIIIWSSRTQTDKEQPVYLLDGRNRLDAMEMVGVQTITKDGKLNPCESTSCGYPAYVKHLHEYHNMSLGGDGISKAKRKPDTDPYDYVISANIQRRHLTSEQKRELIEKLLKAKPEQSNRQIAKQVKVDDKTVAAVRKEKESCAEIPHIKHPKARKTPNAPKEKPKAEVTFGTSCDRCQRVFTQKVFDSPQESHAQKAVKPKIGKADYEALSQSWGEVNAQIKAANLSWLRNALEIHREKVDRILEAIA